MHLLQAMLVGVTKGDLLVGAKVLVVVPVVLTSLLLQILSSSVDVSLRVLCLLGLLSVIPMVVVSLSEEAHLFVLSVVVLQHLVLPNLAMSWRLPALELH
jgi:hypothetical protein